MECIALHRVGNIDTLLTVGIIDREVNLHDAAESLNVLNLDFKTLTLKPCHSYDACVLRQQRIANPHRFECPEPHALPVDNRLVSGDTGRNGILEILMFDADSGRERACVIGRGTERRHYIAVYLIDRQWRSAGRDSR